MYEAESDPEILELFERLDDFEKHYNTAGFLIVSPDGKKVLLVGHPYGELTLWGNPAGHSEDTDVISMDTARRELEEEVGLNLSMEQIEGIKACMVIAAKYDGNSEYRIGVIYTFIANEQNMFQMKPKVDSGECRWFSWGEITALMDHYNPGYMFWGTPYTHEVLSTWVNNSPRGDQSDMKKLYDALNCRYIIVASEATSYFAPWYDARHN